MRVAWLAFAIVLTGCVDTSATADLDAQASTGATGEELPPLGLAATGCFQGGGHSVHPRMFNPLPEPWAPADVLADVGAQLLYSEVPDPMRPIPSEGNTIGNYHATMWCEGWTLDGEARDGIHFGFVGMKVEPPTFDPDPEGVTHHYLVTVIATDDEDVLARLAAAGFGPLRSTAELAANPGGALRVQMWTDGNGAYDSLFVPKALGENDATHVRLWFQQGYGGHGEHATQAEGSYRPIALDLITTGGAHYGAQAQGYFSHSGTAHHTPLPGAYGQTAALMYDGFDRAFEWGPRPDITLTEAYEH